MKSEVRHSRNVDFSGLSKSFPRVCGGDPSGIALFGGIWFFSPRMPGLSPFISSSGAQPMHPGDPRAPMEEVINCHCVLVPVAEGPEARKYI